MELQTINKLYLELSQVATAETGRERQLAHIAETKSARVRELEELLRSACAIAERQGEGTHWDRFIASVKQAGLNGVTARTYRILPGDAS